MSRVIKKPVVCSCENKGTDQLRGNSYIVLPLFFLNPKFQASCHLLWLHSPVCVGTGRKPRRQVFSRRGSYMISILLDGCTNDTGGLRRPNQACQNIRFSHILSMSIIPHGDISPRRLAGLTKDETIISHCTAQFDYIVLKTQTFYKTCSKCYVCGN